ncbi:MAG: AHH domain-containing protein [Rhodopseudomonas palustris]|nr:AHH domain-containing protein [Rhodopseudomonas palustris]
MDAAKTIKGSKLARNLPGSRVWSEMPTRWPIVWLPSSRNTLRRSRAKLKDLGIDINDAANGVFLPKEYHQSLHTLEYYKKVDTASDSWRTVEQAKTGLA